MTQIKPEVTWCGYIDWNLRVFHGYGTPFGSTYNAYLLRDDKPTLIDTVKHYGFEEMLSRIQEVIDPKEIRYIVSNHTEMDHSGTIGKLLPYCPKAEVVCSSKGAEQLPKHFAGQWKFKVVQNGETLNIGKRTLQFFLMPMVHWPDSMATYCEHDQILFPNDAFGQHYASNERFVDELGCDIVFKEAAKYYANIVLPYGQQVLKVLEVLKSISYDMICPSHGLIWRSKDQIKTIEDLYRRWALHETEKKAVIIYDTMWQSTEKMAHRIFEFIEKQNIPVKITSLQKSDTSDIVTDILSSRYVLFGTPILNNRMLPTMAGLLMYLKGLKPKGRKAWTFGSYGWSTVGFKEFEQSVKEAGFDLSEKGHYIKFVPNQNELDELKSIVDELLNFSEESQA